MQGAESLIAVGILKENVQREWTAFKPTVIYGSCELPYITGKEVDGAREREREAC